MFLIKYIPCGYCIKILMVNTLFGIRSFFNIVINLNIFSVGI